MGRLTFEGDFCYIALCTNTRGGSFCEDGYCSQRKVWERLKHLEDLQEQGWLVELPSKVGDTVYCLDTFCSKPGDCMGDCKFCDSGKTKIEEIEFCLELLKHIGKTVFLTQAEAQAALERMEGQE